MSDTEFNSMTDPQTPHGPRSRQRFAFGVVMAAIVGLATISVLFGIVPGRGNDRAQTPAFAPDTTKQPVTVINTASTAVAVKKNTPAPASGGCRTATPIR
jgi:hypothetical protein